MSETRLSPATKDAICGFLDSARGDLESTAGGAPGGVDGGDMTPLLTAMMSKLVSSAASMSEGLAAVSGNVGDTAADFRATDAAVQSTFAGGAARGD